MIGGRRIVVYVGMTETQTLVKRIGSYLHKTEKRVYDGSLDKMKIPLKTVFMLHMQEMGMPLFVRWAQINLQKFSTWIGNSL